MMVETLRRTSRSGKATKHHESWHMPLSGISAAAAKRIGAFVPKGDQADRHLTPGSAA
jgi:hypothetical protein